jgi:hypothetical protein
MKKLILISALILIVGTMSLSAWGIGAAWLLGVGGDDGVTAGNAMLSLKVDQLPIYWGLRFSGTSDSVSVGVIADWLMVRETLADPLNIYVGPGLFAALSSTDDGTTFGLGARVPVGLYIFPLDFLEVFLEVAPKIEIANIGANTDVTFPNFGLMGGIGVRFWFDQKSLRKK